MSTFDEAAQPPTATTEGRGDAWQIELKRHEKGWRAVIEGSGTPSREASLHELIRWLVELSAGLDRPSRGLR